VQWYGFNASFLTREGRRRDEELLKDEAEQQYRLSQMGRKRDTVQRRDDIGRRRDDTGERKGFSAQIMSYILNMLIYVGMILLDNLL
jgi:hypothetical protein